MDGQFTRICMLEAPATGRCRADAATVREEVNNRLAGTHFPRVGLRGRNRPAEHKPDAKKDECADAKGQEQLPCDAQQSRNQQHCEGPNRQSQGGNLDLLLIKHFHVVFQKIMADALELDRTGLIIVIVMLAILITMPWALVIMRFRTCGFGLGRRKISPEVVEKVADGVKDTAIDILKKDLAVPSGGVGAGIKEGLEIKKDVDKPGIPGESTLYAGAGGAGEWQTKDLNDAVNGVVGKQMYGDSWQLQRKGKVSGAVVDGMTKILERQQDRLNAKIDSVSHYEVDLETCPSRLSFWFALIVALVLTVAAGAFVIYLYNNRAEPPDPCLLSLSATGCDAKAYCDNPSTSLDISLCETHCNYKTSTGLYSDDCIRYHCRDISTALLEDGEDLWADNTEFENEQCFDSCIADASEGRTRTTSCLRITCGTPQKTLDLLLPPVDGEGVEDPNRAALDANCAAFCDVNRGIAFESYCIERACGDEEVNRCSCHFYFDGGAGKLETCQDYCADPRYFSDEYCIQLRCEEEPLLHCDQACTGNHVALCVPNNDISKPMALGFLAENIFLDIVDATKTLGFVDSPATYQTASTLHRFYVLKNGEVDSKDVYVIASKIEVDDYWVWFDEYDEMKLTSDPLKAQSFLVISTGQAYVFTFRTLELRNTGAGTLGYRFMGFAPGQYDACPCPFIPALMPRPLNLVDAQWYFGPLNENN